MSFHTDNKELQVNIPAGYTDQLLGPLSYDYTCV